MDIYYLKRYREKARFGRIEGQNGFYVVILEKDTPVRCFSEFGHARRYLLQMRRDYVLEMVRRKRKYGIQWNSNRNAGKQE